MGIEYDYDSEAVRKAARKIRNCANVVSNDAKPKLKIIRSEVSSEFEGEAADALGERLSDLSSDVNSIANGLSKLSSLLFAYADELDEITEKIKNRFS